MSVFWESENDWFSGIIDDYNIDQGYHVQYFDGDQEWLPNLGNVKFQNDQDGKSPSQTFGTTTMGNNNSSNPISYFDDGELEVLPSMMPSNGKEATSSSSIKDRDFEPYMRNNREIMAQDLVRLSENGVILVGTVLGASNIQLNDGHEDYSSSHLTFKVLFVEGGSQPAMFRCKTPIFASAPAADLSNPSWEEGSFKFDMVMPPGPAGFAITGEILVSVYRARPNGGNDMIGQLAFDLGDLSKTGTVEYYQAGIEGRSLTGTYDLLSRSGAEVGSIDVQLNICWKAPPQSAGRRPASSGGLSATGHNKTTTTVGRAAGAEAASATASKAVSKPKSAGGSTRKTGATGGTIVNGKHQPAPQRTIISAQQQKQRTEAARIEKENKKLQERLLAKGAKTEKQIDSVYNNADGKKKTIVNREPQGLTSEQEAKMKGSGPSAAQKKEQARQDEIQQLLFMLNDYKRGNLLQEQENANLKAVLTKLKLHIKKCELSIERIKERNPDAVKEFMSRPAASSASPSSNATKSPRKIAEFTDHNDAELHGIQDEYKGLQGVRQGLIQRIATAKAACEDAKIRVASVSERKQLVKKRLAYDPLIAEILVSMPDSDFTPVDLANYETDKKDDDYLRWDRLQKLMLEITRLRTLYDSGVHLSALASAEDELKETANILGRQAEKLREEITALRGDNDAFELHLRNSLQVSGHDSVSAMRSFIGSMQADVYAKQREQRMEPIEDSYKTMEMALMRSRLKRKEEGERKDNGR